MKTLIVHRHEAYGRLISWFLKSRLGSSVFLANSTQQAVQLIDAHPDLFCVIAEYSLMDGKSDILYRHIASQGAKTHFIVYGNSDDWKGSYLESQPLDGFVNHADLFTGIEDRLGKVLKKSSMSVPALDGYLPIDLQWLKQIEAMNFDLYIRISSDNYVRIYQAGDSFNEDDQKHLQNKKVSQVFIPSIHLHFFLTQMSQRIQNEIAKPTQSLSAYLELSEQAVAVVAHFSQLLGFSAATMTLSKVAVNLCFRKIQSIQEVYSLFQFFQYHPETYIYSHSSALAFLACGLASLMGNSSQEVLHDLAMASLLHDITLKNNEIARYHSLADLALVQDRYSEVEVNSYSSHPKQISQILRKYSDFSDQTIRLILEHHEQPHGTGFPSRISLEKFSPLTPLFLLSERLLEHAWDRKGQIQIKEFLQTLPSEYSEGNFLPILNILKNTSSAS